MAPTLATEQDVKDRMGLNANSTIMASGLIIQRYIEDAEGVVVGATKIDWITDITKVTASVKLLLAVCVSAHAAKEIINYDMSGYSSRAEAVTMLNVNENTFTKRLVELKDLDTNKLRRVPT